MNHQIVSRGVPKRSVLMESTVLCGHMEASQMWKVEKAVTMPSSSRLLMKTNPMVRSNFAQPNAPAPITRCSPPNTVKRSSWSVVRDMVLPASQCLWTLTSSAWLAVVCWSSARVSTTILKREDVPSATTPVNQPLTLQATPAPTPWAALEHANPIPSRLWPASPCVRAQANTMMPTGWLITSHGTACVPNGPTREKTMNWTKVQFPWKIAWRSVKTIKSVCGEAILSLRANARGTTELGTKPLAMMDQKRTGWTSSLFGLHISGVIDGSWTWTGVVSFCLIVLHSLICDFFCCCNWLHVLVFLREYYLFALEYEMLEYSVVLPIQFNKLCVLSFPETLPR